MKREFEKMNEKNVWDKFTNLKEQNIIIKHILAVCPPKIIRFWQSLMKNVPSNISCFSRKALSFCLPNNTNLFRWKLKENESCPKCSNKETQLHVLSNCTSYLDRYKWRHDSILNSILVKLITIMEENIQIYADCANTDRSIKCPSQLFRSKRPDLAVVSGKI